MLFTINLVLNFQAELDKEHNSRNKNLRQSVIKYLLAELPTCLVPKTPTEQLFQLNLGNGRNNVDQREAAKDYLKRENILPLLIVALLIAEDKLRSIINL
jgi:hypothetical protein